MVKRSVMEATMCKVLNKHRHGIAAGAVYIGHGSKWGNPFRIGVDGDRATVIARYATWLRDQRGLLRALVSPAAIRVAAAGCSPAAPLTQGRTIHMYLKWSNDDDDTCPSSSQHRIQQRAR